MMAYCMVYLCLYAVIFPVAFFDVFSGFFVSILQSQPVLIGILAFVFVLLLCTVLLVFHAGLIFVLTRELMAIKGDEYQRGREGVSNLTVAVLAVDCVIVLWVVLRGLAG